MVVVDLDHVMNSSAPSFVLINPSCSRMASSIILHLPNFYSLFLLNEDMQAREDRTLGVNRSMPPSSRIRISIQVPAASSLARQIA